MTSSAMRIGYCTNVHAGADLETTRANLQQHAVGVKQQFSPDVPLGVGLWLSAEAARKLRATDHMEEFGAWLAEAGLAPFTLNGFPYGDFHQPVVKHEVYKPTWSEQARADYTLDLIEILAALLPSGADGSISTLPLQWGTPAPHAEQLSAAAANLRSVADRLAQLEVESGRLIHVCLEPEPGCAMDRAEDVVRFFENYLLADGDEATIRRHIRVCHDVCHSAVMFEEQADAFRKLKSAGIHVGKIQVSSAVILPFNEITPEQRVEALNQLRSFAEDRYLHQTVVRSSPLAEPVFFEDLPIALNTVENADELTGEWRVHFHVPIYLERFGLLQTSQKQILECLETVDREMPTLSHFEVETYAWGVLPDELRQTRLSDGIAKELRWFSDVASQIKMDGV
ncbi:MAG: metabolite traffic protein EboE [Planctomycetota bacterium]